jgi:signal transduction histidine kinase
VRRVILGVSLLWLLVGLVSGAQSSFAGTLQGKPEPLLAAILDALHQSLPWIPATLIAIALALRAPFTRRRRLRALGPHLLGLACAAFLTNLLVVALYWARAGRFDGLGTLCQSAAFWALVRLHEAALVYGVSVATTLGFRSWTRLRQREVELARLETQLAHTRLEVLNAQIRPHFLFNTLHTIGQLWRSGQSAEADAMLDHLGSLFQKVIASTARSQVPLTEELAMVRDYLAIEQARFGPRMRSRVEMTAAALACEVPPLVLQPLVENAVKHGIAASVEAGEVVVSAEVESGRLVLRVRDDGPGLRSNGSHAGTGTGLRNVRERLASLYPQQASVDVTTGADGRGVQVRLELPAIPAGALD